MKIILKSPPNKVVSVPVPKGWTVEEVIATLREMEHTPTHIIDESGNRKTIGKAA